jgi:hypothetical protein
LERAAMDNRQLPKAKVNEIAESLRHEPYRLFFNDCLVKSVRFTKECKKAGISAKIVCCVGLASARIPLLSRRLSLPVIHVWAEVEAERIEVSRPLGSRGILDIVPMDIKPILRVRI